jgi:minor curlin subunit
MMIGVGEKHSSDPAVMRGRRGMQLRLLFAAVVLLAVPSAASAQSIEVVNQFGNQVQPVTINQSSLLNFAGVLQVNSSGAPTATVVQTGMNNAAGILQFGASTSAVIVQSGPANIANIAQMGNFNTGAIAQFGTFNSSVVSQSAP